MSRTPIGKMVEKINPVTGTKYWVAPKGAMAQKDAPIPLDTVSARVKEERAKRKRRVILNEHIQEISAAPATD